MSQSEGQRRIVAILFSDMVGYTEKMGQDEASAIGALSSCLRSQAELVEKFHGTWVRTIGDGVLCIFDSAVEATGCAVEIQRTIAKDTEVSLRIGIHVGDVIVVQNGAEVRLLGDAVNVASRIEAEARPGGICVSERVYEDMLNHKGLTFEPLAQRKLKGVSRLIPLYHVIDEAAAKPSSSGLSRRSLYAIAAAVYLMLGAVLAFQYEGGETSVAAIESPPSAISPRPPSQRQTAAPERANPSPIDAPPIRTRDDASPQPTHSRSRSELQAGPMAPAQAAVPDALEPASVRAQRPNSTQKREPKPAKRLGDRTLVGSDEGREIFVTAKLEPKREIAKASPPSPGPLEIVDQTIREVLRVLQTKGIPSTARLRQIEHIAYARFDFETICRNVIGHHWRRFARSEREEFIRGFEVLLAQRYSDKLKLYAQEKVKILESFIHPNDDVSVRTTIIGRSGRHTRVDYRMRGTSSGDPSQSSDVVVWRVIDVDVEGISIVANYRAQFESILADRKPEDLLFEVRRKISMAHGARMAPGIKTTAQFEKIRKSLLDAWGPWHKASARIWVDSLPVSSKTEYEVQFEANCDCDVLLFAIHDFTDRISLVYSSANDNRNRLSPKKPTGVRLLPAPEIGKYGGYGRETLKLFVTPKRFDFTGLHKQGWEASPRFPKRVVELERFLSNLGSNWDSAVAFVEVVR